MKLETLKWNKTVHLKSFQKLSTREICSIGDNGNQINIKKIERFCSRRTFFRINEKEQFTSNFCLLIAFFEKLNLGRAGAVVFPAGLVQ